jgi:hypothetical protein
MPTLSVIPACRHSPSSPHADTLRHPRMPLAGNQVLGSLDSRLRGNDGSNGARPPSPPKGSSSPRAAALRHPPHAVTFRHHRMPLAGNQTPGSLDSRLRGNDGSNGARPRSPPKGSSSPRAATLRHPCMPSLSVIPACRWRGTRRRGLWIPAFAGMTARTAPSRGVRRRGRHPRGPRRSVIPACRHSPSSPVCRDFPSSPHADAFGHPRMPTLSVIPACRWRGTRRRGLWIPAFAGMTARAAPSRGVRRRGRHRRGPRHSVIPACRHSPSSPVCRWRGTRRRGLWIPAFAGMTAPTDVQSRSPLRGPHGRPRSAEGRRALIRPGTSCPRSAPGRPSTASFARRRHGDSSTTLLGRGARGLGRETRAAPVGGLRRPGPPSAVCCPTCPASARAASSRPRIARQ